MFDIQWPIMWPSGVVRHNKLYLDGRHGSHQNMRSWHAITARSECAREKRTLSFHSKSVCVCYWENVGRFHDGTISLNILKRSCPASLRYKCQVHCAMVSVNHGPRCSSVLRAFAHGAMGRRIDHSWWTHSAISCSSQCSMTGVKKPWHVLSCTKK